MLPPYIQQELTRRLSPGRASTLAKEVGIDPDQPLPAVDPQFVERYEFNGSLDFDLTVVALGNCASVPCRLTFTAELADDVDTDTGKPIRVLGRSQQALHALVATGEAESVFSWVPIDERMFPSEAIERLDIQVEELAQIMERSRRAVG